MNIDDPATSDHERRWRVSGRPAGLGARAWALAFAVVAALALVLAFLHG